MTEGNIVSTEEKRLTLAYENLEELPKNLLVDYAPILEILDLSHNRISNVDFLNNCQNLSTLILDHNLLTNGTVFPKLLNVTTLWLNHNCITKLHPFIERLNESFPNLSCLSLMGNEGAPSYLTGGTYYEYLQYRFFVISWMNKLDYLDDRQVSKDQRDEANRLYGRPFYHKYKSLVANSLSNSHFDQWQRRFKNALESISYTISKTNNSTENQRVGFRPGEGDAVSVQDMGNIHLDSESSTSSQTGISNNPIPTITSNKMQRNLII